MNSLSFRDPSLIDEKGKGINNYQPINNPAFSDQYNIEHRVNAVALDLSSSESGGPRVRGNEQSEGEREGSYLRRS